MLRLVHPAPRGKETRAPKGRRSSFLFPTAEEAARVRAALRSLRRVHGTFARLAEVMGVPRGTLANITNGHNPPSYAIAILAARAAGVPVEQILSPGVTDAGRCALCGRKGGA